MSKITTPKLGMDRSSLPKILSGVSLFLCIIENCFTASIESVADEPNICQTEVCSDCATRLLSYMDQTVDPCKDFYQFSCGKFIRETVIPDDKPVVMTFTSIEDNLYHQLRTILESPVNTSSDIASFKIAKTFYGMCMDEARIEEQGLDRVKQLFKDLGGWPLLEGPDWNSDSFKWVDILYKIRQICGFPDASIVSFDVGIDMKEGKTYVITVSQPAASLIPREHFIKGWQDELVQAYFEYMVDIAVIMGADPNAAKEELTKSLNLEIKLSKIRTPPEELRNMSKLYNSMSISELETKFSFIPWREYLQIMIGENVPLGPNETINVVIPEYFTALEDILNLAESRTIANYLMSNLMAAIVTFLTEELRQRQFQFKRKLLGMTKMKPHWKECMTVTVNSLPEVIGSMYVRNYFNEDSKYKADDMVVLLREELYKIINNADWMDDTTRNTALAKAKAISSYIGYPPELLNDSKLEEYFSDLKVNDSCLLDSVLDLNHFERNYVAKIFRKPVDKKDWKLYAAVAVVNAFYSLNQNSIFYPAGFLQDPIFVAKRPNYMNFGVLGSFIGHEITHGFDDTGKQFNKDGNMVNWWDSITEEKYLEKSKCFVGQYSNFHVEQVKKNINGNLTIGENIADNGGIKEAYNAYQLWVQNHSEEPRLPGLEQYSPNQMFWIAVGSTWCSVYRPEVLDIQILTDEHSPSEFRVIGPLSNSKEFAKDFKCPVGSRMNPETKCGVW